MSGSVSAGRFQDHYSVLGVGRKATTEEIHRAYSALAQKYNPRNGSQPDRAKFEAITLAYETLSNPATRQAFDALLPKEDEGPPAFAPGPFYEAIAGEADRRLAILCILYDRRRQNPGSPGMPVRLIEAMVNFPAEPMFFALWYLKQRGWVALDDKSCPMITADGMDVVERNLPAPERVRALIKPECLAD
ncbi:MAG: J domain-containing protein [Bryobacteraceae bacterium]|nr:J domain-containing protein [Bryobacteraceae bacterium]